MNKIGKVPFRGEVKGFMESSQVRGGFSSRRDLITYMVARNEFFGIDQGIRFVRGGEKGDILSGLISDFKKGKKLLIKGEISYLLIKPSFFASIKEKKWFRDALRFTKVTDWKKLNKEEKKKLGEIVTESWPLEINMVVYKNGKKKYKVILSEEEGQLSGYIWYDPGARIYLLK
jgi:hypothetical protein